MVVFAGFIGDDIDKALDAFRQNGLAGVGLKAVLRNQSGLEFPAAVRRTEKETLSDAGEALSI